MHTEAYHYVLQKLRKIPQPSGVVEFGGRDLNGSVRGLYKTKNYVSIDLEAGPGVDIVADAEKFEWDNRWVVDHVISVETFEHAPNWKQLVARGYELLEDGGYMIITCATDPREPHSTHDGVPIAIRALEADEQYRNVPLEEMETCLREVGFEVLEINTLERGDLRSFSRKPVVNGVH